MEKDLRESVNNLLNTRLFGKSAKDVSVSVGVEIRINRGAYRTN